MRERSTRTRAKTAVFRSQYDNPPSPGPIDRLIKVTQDENNGMWPLRNQTLRMKGLDPRWREMILRQDYGGGAFMSETTFRASSFDHDDPVSVGTGYPIYGNGSASGFWWCGNMPTLPALPTREQQSVELMGFGGDAWRQTAPTAPQSNIAQFVGELKEGLPSLPGSRLAVSGDLVSLLRNSGSEYLNWNFGVRPLLSDLKKMATSVMRSRTIIEQLQRDSGKLVRRNLHLPPALTVSQVSGTFMPQVTPITWYFSRTNPGIAMIKTERIKWFSAQFTYSMYDPGVNSFLSRLKTYEAEARVILGLTPDISTAWELSKFSWLVDWFVDIGGVLQGLSLTSHDRLVATYAYAMSHYTVSADVFSNTALYGHPSFTWNYRVDRKMRQRALPYGFDVPYDGLSAFQTSILVALGINRAPLHLLKR